MWIYKDKRWPNFIWQDGKISKLLANVRFKQGKLIGRMENLEAEFSSEAHLNMLTNEVVKSSAIEGEKLNADEVRSSIARKLGIDQVKDMPSSRHVEGFVEMMIDATQNSQEELTKSRLISWHAALFPTGRSGINPISVGKWRSGSMQVVSGPYGKEKIHFEAPPENVVDEEMKRFLSWLKNERKLDSLIKAGVAHIWFLTMHPFDDGNGRIARAILDMALAKSDGIKKRFYSLSTQIEKERKDYYKQLELQQRGSIDLTGWLLWFLGCLERAIDNAEVMMEQVLYRANMWRKIKKESLNRRQLLILNKMLEANFKGFMNSSKYAKLAKCSQDTALRDIQLLISKEILMKNSSGGRSTSYRLK